jgi:hypothetical protein
MADSGDRYDKIIARLYNEMKTRIDRTAVAMRNEKAPGQVKVPEHDQLKQYLQVRDNPEAWGQLMAEKGVKSATKYYKAGERLIDRYAKKALVTTELPGMEKTEVPKRPTSPAFMQALMGQVQQMQQAANPEMQQQAPVPQEGGVPMNDPALG